MIQPDLSATRVPFQPGLYYTIATLPATLTTKQAGAIAPCSDLTGGAGLVLWTGSAWQRIVPYTVYEFLTVSSVTANTTLTSADGSRSISDPKLGIVWDTGNIAYRSFQINAVLPIGWSNVSSKARLTWKPTGFTGEVVDLSTSAPFSSVLVEYPTLDVF